MKLSLVPKELIDAASDAMATRMASDMLQLGMTDESPLDGFKDLGIVEYDGAEYYASTYTAPIQPEDMQ
jgi:hypothetical protein